jgi:hypothetical protein
MIFMNSVKASLKLSEQAMKKQAYASTTDPVRRHCDLGEAAAMAEQSSLALAPLKPLKTGAGGEIIPPASLGRHGLEDRLKQPDLLGANVTIKRTQLADDAGVFEMAIETAESVKAKGSVQKMLSHQLAGAHHHAMRLLGEADKQRDPIIKAKLMNTSTRLMEAFCKGALTLQKLQTGANQIVTVQHVQINGGQAIIGSVGH